MKKLRALDLFCGAGGASIGLHQAGFDTIVGIDINKNCGKRYPFDFIQADALLPPLNLADFDFVWASPPCQQFSIGLNCSKWTQKEKRARHPNLIPAVRRLLCRHPFTCIENVPKAPIRPDIVLTGKALGLTGINRKRHFETSFMMYYPDPVLWTPKEWFTHKTITVCKSGTSSQQSRQRRKALGLPISPTLKEKRKAMQIPDEYPMTHAEIGEAVPPPYAKFIGDHVMEVLKNA